MHAVPHTSTDQKRVFMFGTESTMGLGATHARDAANPTVRDGERRHNGLMSGDFVRTSVWVPRVTRGENAELRGS